MKVIIRLIVEGILKISKHFESDKFATLHLSDYLGKSIYIVTDIQQYSTSEGLTIDVYLIKPPISIKE